MKKILLIFCGGTISMHKNTETGALEMAYTMDQFFQLEPRIKDLADLETILVSNIDSSNMTHNDWEKIIDVIESNYQQYDGFLITMGTNTMAYASSALSFALMGIGKPVVLTGAQIPAESIATDARNNLANAIRVATMDLAGVFVVFGTKIILGCRAKKMSESELDAFKTFNQKDFGEIGIGIKLNFDTHKKHSKPFIIKKGFDDNIVCLTSIPGLSGKTITDLIDSGVKGLILRAYGSGDLPYEMLPSLHYAQKKEIPIVVTTQCPGGATLMGINDVGLKALDTGVIQAFDMSMEAMSTKLMWLLHQKISYNIIHELMLTNLVGEVDPERAKLYLNKG